MDDAPDTVERSTDIAEEAGLAERFHVWRGASGQRYVFSVFPAGETPCFDEAVIMGVRRNGADRNPAWMRTSGCDRTQAERTGCRHGDADEVHVHLLARDRRSRAAVLRDLRRRQACR